MSFFKKTNLGGTAEEEPFVLYRMKGLFICEKTCEIREGMKGGFRMLGIEDISIVGAVVLSLVSMVGCIVYGIVNWNKGES